MTKLPVRFAIPFSAACLLAACGIDSETTATLVEDGGASGATSGGRGGSFVGEPGGSTGAAGKPASAGAGGTPQGQAGSSATGGKAGTTSSGGAGGSAGSGASGGTTSGVAGNGAGNTAAGGEAGSANTGGAGVAGKAGTGGTSSTNAGSGGTGDPVGGQAGNVASGGSSTTTNGGMSGFTSAAGAGGMGGSVGGGGAFGTGGSLGTGGFGTGGSGGAGPKCGDGKVDKGEDCDPTWGPTNPEPNPYLCNEECKLCPGVLIGTDCYFSPKPEVTWDGAQAVCTAESAELASPDVGQFTDLTKLPGTKDVYWAAVRQAGDAMSATSGWTWRAGTRNGLDVNDVNWSNGEPNDQGHTDESKPGEDCGAVIRSRAMKYDDKSCESKYPVLCQRSWK